MTDCDEFYMLSDNAVEWQFFAAGKGRPWRGGVLSGSVVAVGCGETFRAADAGRGLAAGVAGLVDLGQAVSPARLARSGER